MYKLRCKLAPEGEVVPRPGEPEKAGVYETQRDKFNSRVDDEEDTSEVSQESESDTDIENPNPEFIEDECLFCNEKSGTFDANVTHMSKSHSFIIPYQKSLSVDFETLIWYLQFVIYGYRECILCGTRRSSVEAVKQHMIGKGHCRFDVNGDLADFYDLSDSEKGVAELVQPDDTTLRLPSGKILSHQAHQAARPHGSRQSSEHSQQPPVAARLSASTALERKDRKAGAITTLVSQLSTNDQRSLAHLSSAEQRSVLATRKKQLDMARREQRRAQVRVERLGNRTLMKHFKNDVPGRSLG